MTVQELITKLSEIPEELRSTPVWVETEEVSGELTEVTAESGGATWFLPTRIRLSARY